MGIGSRRGCNAPPRGIAEQPITYSSLPSHYGGSNKTHSQCQVDNPSTLILEAMDYQGLAAVRGFIYLGLCGGQCSEFSCGRPGWEQFTVSTPVASACMGYCTHSYMLQKTFARALFNEVHLYCVSLLIHNTF